MIDLSRRLTLLAALIAFFASADSAEGSDSLEVEQAVFYGIGAGRSSHLLEDSNDRYGINLVVFRQTQNYIQQIYLQKNSTEIAVLTPVSEKPVEVNYDIDFSWSKTGSLDQRRGFFLEPRLGLRFQQQQKVVCKKKDDICFDAQDDDRNVNSQSNKVKPLFGANLGWRVAHRFLYLQAMVETKTDLEDTYSLISFNLGWRFTLNDR